MVLLYLTDCSFGFYSTPFPTHFHSPSSAQLYLETSQAEPFRVQYRCCAGARPFLLPMGDGQTGSTIKCCSCVLPVRDSGCLEQHVMQSRCLPVEKLATFLPGLWKGERQSEDAVDRAERWFGCLRVGKNLLVVHW